MTMSTNDGPVQVENRDGIALLRLNRPAQMNAVNDELRAALIAALQAADRDDAVSAVVLAGSGPRAFCAGRDLNDIGGNRMENLPRSIEAQHALYRAVRNVDKPCVAAIHGVAAGAGFQVALCADLRLATPGARIGQPEVKAGMASIVGSFLMTMHVGIGHNSQLSLTGELVSGRRAYEIGLVNELVDSDEPDAVLDAAIARARALAALPRTAVRVSKQRLRALSDPGFEEACVAAIRYQLECYADGSPQAAVNAFFKERGKAA